MSKPVTIVGRRASPTTRVAIGIARSAQGAAPAKWLADRQAELLPIPYFHVVFTLPAPIAAVAFQNKSAVYAILFKTVIEAVTTLAANPRRLGARIGGLAILHTWGQARTILTFIASCPAVDFRSMALDGFVTPEQLVGCR
jgi:hypothetical protein